MMSCISRLLLHFYPHTRLLLHFYPHIQDTERQVVDETVELILGVFADIQTRLAFPSGVSDKVVQSINTQRSLLTADTGVIHGIPSALSELTSLTRVFKRSLRRRSFTLLRKRTIITRSPLREIVT